MNCSTCFPSSSVLPGPQADTGTSLPLSMGPLPETYSLCPQDEVNRPSQPRAQPALMGGSPGSPLLCDPQTPAQNATTHAYLLGHLGLGSQLQEAASKGGSCLEVLELEEEVEGSAEHQDHVHRLQVGVGEVGGRLWGERSQ